MCAGNEGNFLWTELLKRRVSSSWVVFVVGKEFTEWTTHLLADLTLKVAGSWWPRLFLDHVLPPTLGHIVLQNLVLLICTWIASLFCHLRCRICSHKTVQNAMIMTVTLLNCIECIRRRLLLLMIAVSVCQPVRKSVCHAAWLCIMHLCSLCQITLASCWLNKLPKWFGKSHIKSPSPLTVRSGPLTYNVSRVPKIPRPKLDLNPFSHCCRALAHYRLTDRYTTHLRRLTTLCGNIARRAVQDSQFSRRHWVLCITLAVVLAITSY